MATIHAENHPPHDQPPIYTSDVKRLVVQANLLNSTEGPPASAGLVVGASGTGKTIAVHYYLANEEPERLSRCAIVDVIPQITSKGILSAILHQIGEHPRYHTSRDTLLQTIDVLQQGKTRLLILDQGDYLEREAIEALSMLVERTACSLLLVGLPTLVARLKIVPSFADRIGLTLQFGLLADTEIYELFLPQLVLPGWEFHSTSEEDLRLGRYLWRNSRPSLRRVRAILGYASRLAQMRGSRKILFEDLSTAVQMTGFPDKWKNDRKDEGDGKDDESTRH